jgi:anti-sigma factor RsiW
MKHRVKERAIFALLDGKLESREARALEEHIESCETCRDFLEQVQVTRRFMRGLAAKSPPPVDWNRVDAGIQAGIEKSAPRPHFGGLFLWGSLAATAAAAFLVTWLIASPRGHEGPTPPPLPTKESVATSAAVEREPAKTDTPRRVEAFVTFVAGEVSLSRAEAAFVAANLESALDVGTNIRTGEGSSIGLQLGDASACRLQSESEAQLVSLDSELRLDLQRGRVSCSTGREGSSAPLVLAVMDLVASAEGSARFSLRRAPQVVIVELAEGTLHVDRSNGGPTLSEPGRYLLGRDDTGALSATRDEEQQEALTLPEITMMPRRTIASLQIPPVESIDRVEVDGVDYGSLPLSLRRRPGVARVILFAEGREPVVREIEVGFGPRVVDVASLELEPEDAEELQRSRERRVAPRVGTYSKTQVARLRAVVGQSVRSCYERALKRNPSIWGRINVRFTVSNSGEPQRVNVSSLAGGSEGVNRCIESAISSDRFPPPMGGYVPIEQTITLVPRF